MATSLSDRLAGGLLILTLLVTSFGVACRGDRSEARVRPNIILITLDTLRADHLGCYGSEEAGTPHLDALATNGVRFEQAISAVPLTLPSHATMLTGLLPLHHGVRQNGAGALSGHFPLVQSILREEGYRTGAFVGAFVLDRRFGLDRGFDVYDDEIPRDPTKDVQLEAERPGSFVVDRAIEWIGKNDARPLFAWVHLFDAHAPYVPPEPFRERFAENPYAGEVASVDHEVGRLLAALGPRAAETVIVVAGDHGEALGDHGEMTHGLLLYEGTLRVPLIMSGPGIAPGAVVRTAVSLADLAPTIAALAGTSPGRLGGDGRDLSTSIAGGEEPGVKLLYSETQYPTLFGWSSLSAVREGAWKLIEGRRAELFDLGSDPGENNDRAEDERRRFHALTGSLEAIRGTEVEPQVTNVDEETRRKLESLGYVGSVGSPGGDGADPRDRVRSFVAFEKANLLLGSGEMPEAVAMLRDLVREDGSNAVFRGTLGRALRESGRLDEAVDVYRDAVALRPDDAEAWYNLAVTYRDLGRLDEAALAIEESLRRNDGNAEAHNVLGILHSIRGDGPRAMEEFRRAVELDPRSARGFNNLGNAFREAGQFEEAAERYRVALDIAPEYPDPCNGIGTVEVQQGRPGDAITWFDRALELSPDFHEARLNRAIALETAGRADEAIEEYAEFLARTDSRTDLAAQRDVARRLLGRLQAIRSGR